MDLTINRPINQSLVSSVAQDRSGRSWNLIVGPGKSWKLKFVRLVFADVKARTT